MLKYSKSINHYTAWNLTKLDILDTFLVIKVAVAYKDPKTGQQLDYFPSDLNSLDELEVVWKEFEGWMTPTTAVKTFVWANIVLLAGKRVANLFLVRPAQASTSLR